MSAARARTADADTSSPGGMVAIASRIGFMTSAPGGQRGEARARRRAATSGWPSAASCWFTRPSSSRYSRPSGVSGCRRPGRPRSTTTTVGPSRSASARCMSLYERDAGRWRGVLNEQVADPDGDAIDDDQRVAGDRRRSRRPVRSAPRRWATPAARRGVRRCARCMSSSNGSAVAMNTTAPSWRRPISTASALLPLRAPPMRNVSAPISVVDAALGGDSAVVGVLDVAHLGHRVGDVDDRCRRIATRDHDADVRRPLDQRR